MKRKRRLFGILLIITALIIMQLPVSEADAATSASDFKMEGTTLVKYRGTEESVSVPDTVEVIGEGAFEGNDYVELVVLPKTVKKVEAYAFWDCENLETVVLNTGMTEVGDYAFANCKGLTKMTIPENIRSIGVQAFLDCVNMTDITIAPEVTAIHETAFDGCYKLTIHCEKGSVADKYAEDFYERQKEMPEYEDVDNYHPDKNKEEAEVTQTPAPTPAREAEPGTVLGDTRVVGNQAVIFIDNTTVEVLSGDVPDIDLFLETAGENKENVMGLSKYAIVDKRIVADQAYYRNDTIRDVSVPEGVSEIGQFAYARSSLEKIQLPEGIVTIGYGAFYHCDNLTEIVLPGTVENVEPKAFTHTAWVEDFLANGEDDYLISGGVLLAYRGEQSNVTIPDGVRVIAAEAFANHNEIKEVVFPESLVTIGEAAFENCENLSVVLFGDKVEQIKDRAFSGCKIDNILLPKSVEELGIGAFSDSVRITYSGAVPAVTHEVSAERLSNESYRRPTEESGEAGVKAGGVAGVSAKLEGATRSYTFTVNEATNNSSFEEAYNRCFSREIPKDCLIYALQLTDNSNIPITKLGKQLLQVNIPISDNYATQKLQVYSLDRNGQLEEVESEHVRIDGEEYLRLELDFLSEIGIVGTGNSNDKAVIIEETTNIESFSGAPTQLSETSTVRYQWIIGGILVVTGLFCVIYKKRI